MGVSAIYIDGGYLDKVLYYQFNNQRLDFEKLSKAMANPDELLRAYYYHCLPYQSNPPTEDERSRYSSMHRFVTALGYLPRFQVRLGKLAYRGTTADGVPIFMQKRVDCMLGVDMAILAGKGKITNVALLAGDGDYIPIIEAVKREGVLVTLWHGGFARDTAPSRELVEISDERVELTPDTIDPIKRT